MTRLVTAPSPPEGAGFPIRRPFSGEVPETKVDPLLLLDHVGPIAWGQGEAKGAPWHPHRGFETVASMMDGVIEHHDVTGGGGVSTNEATRWSFQAPGHHTDKVGSR